MLWDWFLGSPTELIMAGVLFSVLGLAYLWVVVSERWRN
jgi:hypothetical protein